MVQTSLRDLAGAQMKSLRLGRFAEPFSDRFEGFDLKVGYALAAELVRLRRLDGEKTVGRKIGFTNQALWKDFGLHTPIWANIYDSSLCPAQNGRAEVPLEKTCQPRIEPEIVFKIRRIPLPASQDPEGLLACMEWLALGFEVVDCHYPGWRFTPADAVADFGLHRALIVGTPRVLSSRDRRKLAEELAEFRLILRRGTEVVAEGFGKNVLGSPLLAMDFLNRILKKYRPNEPLTPGEIVTTGTLTPAFPITSGETWSAAVEGISLPPLSVNLV